MKSWIKSGLIGGLIAAGLALLFWLYFIFKLITCKGDMCGLAGGAIMVYGLPSIILSFIIGAIIGIISNWAYNIEKRLITKWSKIGFVVGVLWPLWFSTYRTLTSKFGFFELLLSFFKSIPIQPFTTIILSVLSIVVGSWVFWLIGAAINRRKK